MKIPWDLKIIKILIFVEIVFIADYWSNSELILYCKPEDFKLLGKEHNFSLMNHCYEIDWLYGWAVIDRFATLGHSRGFIKNGIKYIPIAGWFFKLAEHIFLERDFEKDKEVIEKQIQYTLEINEPAWVSNKYYLMLSIFNFYYQF